MTRVVLVGSSGGNLYRLGGADPAQLIGAVRNQLSRAGIDLVAVCFVAATGSFDASTTSASGRLWLLNNGVLIESAPAPVAEISELARTQDEAIAALIAAGSVDGVIFISADPARVNAASVEATIKADLPAAGSGGASVAAATARGVRFIAVSGTTGTTTDTRAIGYVTGFAREWNLPYRPVDRVGTIPEVLAKYDPRPVLVDAMPAVLAIAAVIGVCRHIGSAASTIGLLLPLIRVAICVCAATRVARIGQSAVLAGVIAGVLAEHCGLLGALTAGFSSGVLSDVLVAVTLRARWPATSATIVASGGTGLICGGAARLVLQRAGPAIDRWLQQTLRHGLHHAGLGIGLLLGALMWPILLRGLYHSIVLALMAVEFSAGGSSFFAALDMVCLVAVSAGFALAAVTVPAHAADRRPGARTLTINVGFGTYVEGSLPQITSRPTYTAVAIIAAGAGGAIIGAGHTYGVTYIPLVALPVVGSSWLPLTVGIVTAAGLAFLGTGAVNLASRG